MKANSHFINNPLPNEASKTDYDKQPELTKSLVTAAQNGDRNALERLCIFYEPLFKKEMRREIFYNSIGYEEGLSLARLKFIEIVLNYNGADFILYVTVTLPVITVLSCCRSDIYSDGSAYSLLGEDVPYLLYEIIKSTIVFCSIQYNDNYD